MNTLKLYHGADHLVGQPEFGRGNANNDYGLGFYCTETIELAKEWACAEPGKSGYANAYLLDMDGLSVLNLCEPTYNILNWLAVLMQHRLFSTTAPIALTAKKYLLEHFAVDITPYDVIIGYRADDSYFSFARDFLNNTISVEQLERAMRLGKLGEQVVLKSQKAFAQIRFLPDECEPADSSVYYPLRQKRDRDAKNAYLMNERMQSVVDGLFVRDIVARGLTNGDFNTTVHK